MHAHVCTRVSLAQRALPGGGSGDKCDHRPVQPAPPSAGLSGDTGRGTVLGQRERGALSSLFWAAFTSFDSQDAGALLPVVKGNEEQENLRLCLFRNMWLSPSRGDSKRYSTLKAEGWMRWLLSESFLVQKSPDVTRRCSVMNTLRP